MAIQQKEKICKGIDKAKGFGCGSLSDKRTFGLCPVCKYKWATTTEAGKLWFETQMAFKKKKAVVEEKRKHTHEKSLKLDWGKKLQTEINGIVRAIDYGLTCLARRKRGQIHAGHVFARGGNQTIRYNLHNIHRQNAQSNHFQNDDGLLREGLINEYGSEYMEFISDLRQTPSLTFNNNEYRELTIKARLILKDLLLKDRIYSKSERIELRNRINVEIGIYDKKYCEFKNL